MSLKKFDFLSPKISLFYNGNKRHTSNVGSILTIMMIFLSGLYIFYLIYNIARHNFSNFMFYKNYLNDVGYYAFNDTGGIFHYFQLFDYKTLTFGEYNSKYIRIFMTRINYKNFNKDSLNESEHWVYDLCREGIDNKNIPQEVFEENNNFSKGACLRYYYDNFKKEYFPIEDKKNFKYPYLIHGSGRNDNLLLETVVEKCDNESIITNLLGPCGGEKEIQEYIDLHKAIFFQLLEKQVNTDNYKKSIYQYIYSISGSLDSINVPVNNVNLMPFFIEIKKGIFLPKKIKIITYLFDDNRKTTFENSKNIKFLAIFDYWMVNTCQVIKGGYNDLYDILPNIGGVIQLIYYLFFSINYCYNHYTIIQDTNKLFFNIYSREYEEKENNHNKKLFSNYVNSIRDEILLRRRKSKLKRSSKIEYKNNFRNLKEKYNYLKNNKISKTDINIFKDDSKYKSMDKNDIINNTNLSNSNDLIIDLPKKNIVSNTTHIDIVKNKKNTLILKDNFKSNEKITKRKEDLNPNKNRKMDFLYYQFTYQLQEFFYHKNNELKVEPLNQNIISQFITFINYIISFFGNHKKKRVFFVFNKLREKVIGEENLFKTKIYLYHLERYFNIREIEKIDILELYNN